MLADATPASTQQTMIGGTMSDHVARPRLPSDQTTGSDSDITIITTTQELREALGGDSLSTGVNTIRRQLEPVDQEWLAASRFCMIATSGADGSCDVSPRGGMTGFVLILSPTTIVLPEYAGNRRGDGYANLLENGHVGLFFMIPPREDALRINGGAVLVRNPPWFDSLRGPRPELAIRVQIDEVFYHCVKAFHRSAFWKPETWHPEGAPSRAHVAHELAALGVCESV